MKSQPVIALACLLGLGLFGCDRREETSTTPTAETPQPAAAPAGEEPAAGALTSAQDATEETPAPSGAPCNAAHGKQPKVTAGEYCVCDIGTHEVHQPHKAKHLEMGQAVVINELDWVTDVQLGSNAIEMMRSTDETQLAALVRYQHQNTGSGNPENVKHIVRITPEDNLSNLKDTECDKSGTKNVLRVSFCYKKSDKWDCEARDFHHNGDTHIQN